MKTINLKRRKFLKFILTVFGILGLSKIFESKIIGTAHAWTEPGTTPPGGNVPLPLNTGAAWQAKQGGLELNAGNLHANGLIIRNGNVGIGVTAPTTALTVRGASGPWPSGWGPGIHTWDLYAGGTIAAGTGGALNAWMSRDGHAFFAGNVGIGTPAPGHRLHVVGTTQTDTLHAPHRLRIPVGTNMFS